MAEQNLKTRAGRYRQRPGDRLCQHRGVHGLVPCEGYRSADRPDERGVPTDQPQRAGAVLFGAATRRFLPVLMEDMVDRVVNKLLHCVIKNVNTVAKEAGPAEAAKLVGTILRQAREISVRAGKSEGDVQDMKPATPSQRVLRMLFWETTIRCNLACVHCRRLESNEAGVADLSTAQAETAHRTTWPNSAGASRHMPVLVFSGGEPLCRERSVPPDRSRPASTESSPRLATNGTMIDRSRHRPADSRQRSRPCLGESRRRDRRRPRPDAADPRGLRPGDRGHSASARAQRAFSDQCHADQTERPAIAGGLRSGEVSGGGRRSHLHAGPGRLRARRWPRRTCSRPSSTSRSCGRSTPWKAGGRFRSK